MPKYRSFDGARVSGRWHTVLSAARVAGVQFHINSGHRTIGEQWALYRQNMLRPGVPRPGHPLTAVPSPLAPHIRLGRANHALDVNSLDGGEARLEAWVRRHGGNWMNTVASESWHGELSASDLARLAARFQGPPVVRPGDHGQAVKRARWLLSQIPGHAVPVRRRHRSFYGEDMAASVRRLQRSAKLKQDGIIGPRTWRLLERKARR